MFIRLPSTHSQDGRQAQARRAPLTPSTTTPPSVSTQSSSATRRDSGCGDATKARAILSRVATSPSSPKRITPPSTPKPQPRTFMDEVQRHPAMVGAMERRWTDTQEATKYWADHKQRDGYISFPDFEKYFPSYDNALGEHQREEVAA